MALMDVIKAAVPQPFRIVQNDSAWPSTYRMCKDFEANLNEFPAYPPMICERKLSPKFPQFRRPSWREWTAAEIWERRKLLQSIHATVFPQAPRDSQQDWESTLQRKLAENKVRVREARDVPPGEPPQRWVLYEFQRLPPTSNLYEQYLNCSLYRYYVKLSPDQEAVAEDRGNRLVGFGDFLIYRDVERGDLRFRETWDASTDFEDAAIEVDEGCRIQYVPFARSGK
jgi:hypothetical protein